ncbi:MAG: imidazoleglycerol-phosphate dehydratase [Dethiosulfovibrio sp.]|nr:imidazoleglycerol-phosphate dehydratase [Dethiosulfovibrio sp.]
MISQTRTTKETSVEISLEVAPIEQTVSVETGCPFMDHMITLLAFHGGWSLTVSAQGDDVDDHHITEDLAITLGSSVLKSLEGRTYRRYGWCAMPMDGTLVLTSVDLSGRGSLTSDLPFPTEKCGSFDTELIEEFWRAFARESRSTVHLRALSVDNSHHLAEATFKGMGQALKQAMEDDRSVRSTKGVLV